MQLYWSALASPHPSSTTTATGFPLGSFGWSGSVHENPELAITNETGFRSSRSGSGTGTRPSRTAGGWRSSCFGRYAPSGSARWHRIRNHRCRICAQPAKRTPAAGDQCCNPGGKKRRERRNGRSSKEGKGCARRRPHRGRVDFHRRAPAAASRRGGVRERWVRFGVLGLAQQKER